MLTKVFTVTLICLTVTLLLACCTNIVIKFLLSTPWAIKNGATFIFTITLANVDRFQ